MSWYGSYGPRGRGDPFASMRQDLGRLFDEFGRLAQAAPGGARMGLSRADMCETEDAVEIEIDAPGVRPEGLAITLRDDMLIVRAVRSVQRDEPDRNWHVRERAQTVVARTIQLPFTPNPEAITAGIDQGVLHIRIEKEREPKRRAVKIPVGGGQSSGPSPRRTDGPQGPVDPAI